MSFLQLANPVLPDSPPPAGNICLRHTCSGTPYNRPRYRFRWPLPNKGSPIDFAPDRDKRRSGIASRTSRHLQCCESLSLVATSSPQGYDEHSQEETPEEQPPRVQENRRDSTQSGLRWGSFVQHLPKPRFLPSIEFRVPPPALQSRMCHAG